MKCGLNGLRCGRDKIICVSIFSSRFGANANAERQSKICVVIRTSAGTFR